MPESPSVSWGQMMEEAEAAAPPKMDPAPIGGPYDFTIVSTRVAQSSAGKPGIGFTAKVDHGPYANARASNTQWISKESGPAMGVFFRIMNTLGLDKAWFSKVMDRPVDDPTTVQQIADALVGARFSGRVTDHDTRGDRTYANCTVNSGASTPAPAGTAPVQAGPPAPVTQVAAPSAPTPQAPAAPAPQAPAPAPTTASPWDSGPPPPPPF